MDAKKLLVVGGVVLLAVYLGTRLAGPPADGLAMAAAGAGWEPGKGLVAVTTGAPGTDTNRLVLVDTVKKRLAVYKINSKSLGLVAMRGYQYDLKLDDSVALDGQEWSYAKIKDFVLKSNLTKEQKEGLPLGRELVLTTDGASQQDGNRIILVNPEEKRAAVYRLQGNLLQLVAVRHYDEDMVAECLPDKVAGDGHTRAEMVTARERNEAEQK
jgi:hypothetical protein